MRLMTIASGSSGNCTYVGTDDTHILIDAGVSKKRIVEGLTRLGIGLSDLSGIFITHEHSDHIAGLRVLTKNTEIPIFASRGTIDGIVSSKGGNEIDKGLLNVIKGNQCILNDVVVDAFAISHDANEPSAYTVSSRGKKAAVVTDLGEYNRDIAVRISDVNALVLEANHDKNMLLVGPYPYYLKQRILGKRGHLSNEDSGRLLASILHNKLVSVQLGHLSRENNYAELAYQTVINEIDLAQNGFKSKDFNISVAKREEPSNIIEF